MKNSHKITPIGWVENKYGPDDHPLVMKKDLSVIEILKQYEAGLLHLATHKQIVVIFGLDKTRKIHLIEKTRFGNVCGIFACRSPYRPNHLGITECTIVQCNGNRLVVYGLDACNGSPIYDIKCKDR